MAGVEHIPVALFVIAEGLSLDAINHKLQQNSYSGVWYFWLATNNYDKAPKKRTDNRVDEGTVGPVESFISPFADKTIEEVAEWLKNIPEDVDLDRRFFAVLDEHSEANDTVMFCRIGDGETEGKKGELQYFPQDANKCRFGYIPAGSFDDDLFSYQRLQRYKMEPDLSRGVSSIDGPSTPRNPDDSS